jgi:hypothetical protein
VSDVFLATDDARLDVARIAAANPQLNVVYQRRRRVAAAGDAAVHTIADMLLAARARHFVGALSLEMPRVIYAVCMRVRACVAIG